jgi:hypothetical protein
MTHGDKVGAVIGSEKLINIQEETYLFSSNAKKGEERGFPNLE